MHRPMKYDHEGRRRPPHKPTQIHDNTKPEVDEIEEYYRDQRAREATLIYNISAQKQRIRGIEKRLAFHQQKLEEMRRQLNRIRYTGD